MSSLPYAYVKLLSDKASIPKRKTENSAGFDITLSESVQLEANEVKKLHTGIAIAIQDNNFYIQIHSRSSTIFKWNVLVIDGVIDIDYRGEVLIVCKNLDTKNSVLIPQGTALAQLLFTRISTPSICWVPHLSETARGAGGFGSTDKATRPPNQQHALEEGWFDYPEQGYIAWRFWDPNSFV